MAMTLHLLLSLLHQSRTELKLAKHANRHTTAWFKAAMAAYNWCARALAGMKKRGGGCYVSSLAKQARATAPAGTAPWPRATAMTMADATVVENMEDTAIIDLKKARACERKAWSRTNQTDTQHTAKKKGIAMPWQGGGASPCQSREGGCAPCNVSA